MLAHGVGSGIVGGEREARVAKLGQHEGEVARGAVEVLLPIVGIHAKRASSIGHQLPEPYRPDTGDGVRIVRTLDLYIGAIEVEPVRDGDIRRTEPRVARVAQSGLLDRGEDIRAWCERARGQGRDVHPFTSLGAAFFAQDAQPV
jgi:hypothetical protein